MSRDGPGARLFQAQCAGRTGRRAGAAETASGLTEKKDRVSFRVLSDDVGFAGVAASAAWLAAGAEILLRDCVGRTRRFGDCDETTAKHIRSA